MGTNKGLKIKLVSQQLPSIELLVDDGFSKDSEVINSFKEVISSAFRINRELLVFRDLKNDTRLSSVLNSQVHIGLMNYLTINSKGELESIGYIDPKSSKDASTCVFSIKLRLKKPKQIYTRSDFNDSSPEMPIRPVFDTLLLGSFDYPTIYFKVSDESAQLGLEFTIFAQLYILYLKYAFSLLFQKESEKFVASKYYLDRIDSRSQKKRICALDLSTASGELQSEISDLKNLNNGKPAEFIEYFNCKVLPEISVQSTLNYIYRLSKIPSNIINFEISMDSNSTNEIIYDEVERKFIFSSQSVISDGIVSPQPSTSQTSYLTTTIENPKFDTKCGLLSNDNSESIPPNITMSEEQLSQPKNYDNNLFGVFKNLTPEFTKSFTEFSLEKTERADYTEKITEPKKAQQRDSTALEIPDRKKDPIVAVEPEVVSKINLEGIEGNVLSQQLEVIHKEKSIIESETAAEVSNSEQITIQKDSEIYTESEKRNQVDENEMQHSLEQAVKKENRDEEIDFQQEHSKESNRKVSQLIKRTENELKSIADKDASILPEDNGNDNDMAKALPSNREDAINGRKGTSDELQFVEDYNVLNNLPGSGMDVEDVLKNIMEPHYSDDSDNDSDFDFLEERTYYSAPRSRKVVKYYTPKVEKHLQLEKIKNDLTQNKSPKISKKGPDLADLGSPAKRSLKKLSIHNVNQMSPINFKNSEALKEEVGVPKHKYDFFDIKPKSKRLKHAIKSEKLDDGALLLSIRTGENTKSSKPQDVRKSTNAKATRKLRHAKGRASLEFELIEDNSGFLTKSNHRYCEDYVNSTFDKLSKKSGNRKQKSISRNTKNEKLGFQSKQNDDSNSDIEFLGEEFTNNQAIIPLKRTKTKHFEELIEREKHKKKKREETHTKRPPHDRHRNTNKAKNRNKTKTEASLLLDDDDIQSDSKPLSSTEFLNAIDLSEEEDEEYPKPSSLLQATRLRKKFIRYGK